MADDFVLFGFGGWNDAAFVAAEVRDRRNIARSLLLSIAVITAVYLLVNFAYLNALGISPAPRLPGRGDRHGTAAIGKPGAGAMAS